MIDILHVTQNQILNIVEIPTTTTRPPQSEFVPASAWVAMKCACQDLISITPYSQTYIRYINMFKPNPVIWHTLRWKSYIHFYLRHISLSLLEMCLSDQVHEKCNPSPSIHCCADPHFVSWNMFYCVHPNLLNIWIIGAKKVKIGYKGYL